MSDVTRAEISMVSSVSSAGVSGHYDLVACGSQVIETLFLGWHLPSMTNINIADTMLTHDFSYAETALGKFLCDQFSVILEFNVYILATKI